MSGPKSQELALEVADAVTFVLSTDDDRVETTNRVRDFAGRRDIELAQHVAAVGDGVAPFMAAPNLDTAALRAADSLVILPSDPAAAAEEIQRRREEIGFSYFVIGADFADTLAPVVAKLAGQQHASQVNSATTIASPLPNRSSSASAKPVRTSGGSATPVVRPTPGSSTPVPAS